MTIGDVLGIAGLIFTFGICSWAVMTALALFFPSRCRSARDVIEVNAWLTLIVGLLVTVIFGGLGIAFLASPAPAMKLVGWVIETALLSIGAFGAGGLAQLLASRLKLLQPDLTEYGLISRAAALLFICALTPILGWFLIGPVILGMAVGSGSRALFARRAPVLSGF